MCPAVAETEYGAGQAEQVNSGVEASAGGIAHGAVENRPAILAQQFVIDQLAFTDAEQGGTRLDTVFRRRIVVGRIAQREQQVGLLDDPQEEGIGVFRLFRQKLGAQVGIAHRLDLVRQRQVFDCLVAGVQRKRMIAEIEAEQLADRARIELAVNGDIVVVCLGQAVEIVGGSDNGLAGKQAEIDRAARGFGQAANDVEFIRPGFRGIGNNLKDTAAGVSQPGGQGLQFVDLGHGGRGRAAVAETVG